MLIDRSGTETSTAGTSPNSDSHGSIWKHHAYLTQHAIYSGYTKQFLKPILKKVQQYWSSYLYLKINKYS